MSVQIIENILTDDEINFILNHSTVIEKFNSTNSKIVFTIDNLSDSIKTKIIEKLGLKSNTTQIPFTIIKGDSHFHVDTSFNSNFENTYLYYLTDTEGELVIEDEEYPITKGTCYVFKNGMNHGTRNTMDSTRLMIGPMNEFVDRVGFSAINYYATEADALAGGGNFIAVSNAIYTVGNVDIGSIGSITSWSLSSNSTGSSSQSVIYNNGDLLNPSGFYFLYPNSPCFLEGSEILCQINNIDTYVPIEQIKKGTMVKTNCNGYKKVEVIGKGTIYNDSTNERTKNKLYKCSKENYKELEKDLYITGCHSILVDNITDVQRQKTLDLLGKIYVTENKYRLMACVDERSIPWNSKGDYTIWHFALENEDKRMNYGVYANGGLLVESCSISSMKNKSNMDLI